MEHIQDNQGNGDANKSFHCKKCPLDKNGLAKSFNSQILLNRHLKRSHGPLCFTCQVCSKQFRQASNFEKHERTHTPNTDPRLKCEWCSLTLCSKQNLQKHSFVVHNKKITGVKYFACELCSLEFVNKSSLERHVVHKHVVDKEFKCGVCSKAFIDQETLDKHFKNTHEVRKISHFCDICPKGFKYRKSVIRHLGVKHLKFFYCDKCLRSYSNKTAFDGHIHPKSEVYFKCKICKNESFDSQCNLDIHTNVHHSSLEIIKCGRTNIVKIKTKNKNVKPEELSDKNQVKCQFCSKTFDHESYLQPHRNLQHPDEEWACSAHNCSETFKQYKLLKHHVRKHHVALVCNICQKSFKNQKNLRFHEKTHAVEKQYKCNKCTKSFVCPSYLKTHVAHNHGGPTI